MTQARYEFVSALSLAWDSILAHKLRSFLTLLGVMIGVASVIIVGSAIDGLGIYAEESTAKAFGSESYLIAQVAQTGNMTRNQVFEKRKYNRELKLADERYLQSLNGDNTLYSPYRQASADTKRENLTSEDTSILGSAANMAEIRDIVVTEGRFFSQTEEQNASFVAVIGDDLKNNLFPGIGSPLGKTFKIQDLEFTVVGVQERLGSAFGRSQDNSAYIPVTSGAIHRDFRTPQSRHRDSDAGVARFFPGGAAHAFPPEARGAGSLRFPDARGHPWIHRQSSLHGGRGCNPGDAHLSGGGRHRDHEHHAGERHGAHA
jgi:putative ABC transport system permease protein